MSVFFRLFGWEIELMAWVGLRAIFGGHVSRKRSIDPIPWLDMPRTPIDMLYAEAYCPVGGIAIEVWKTVGEDEDDV